MSANFYCWMPELELNPDDQSFGERIDRLYEQPKPQPAAAMLAFVADILARYPDLTETDDTVWADGPMVNNILGQFINMSVIWSRIKEAEQVLAETAKRHGLYCYDPQSKKLLYRP